MTTTRRHTLVEFQTTKSVALSAWERDAIRRASPKLRVEPTIGRDGYYDLTPDQRIGVIALPEVVLEIRPKVPMSSVLFLVSYGCGLVRWDDPEPELAENADLVDLIAIILARAVTRATRRGLLFGYQTVDDVLQAPRGRILFDEHLRRRHAKAPPVDVRHDIFTADILENRLLLAALVTLNRVSSRSPAARRATARAERLFGEVAIVPYRRHAVPDVVFTRLNSHYEPALALATLVLRSASLDLGAGGARSSAFLVDMNKVFEQFVRIALREALGVDRRNLPDSAPPLRLDEAGAVPLKPDLCLIEQDQVVWVGDAKYKRLAEGEYRNADLYQLLAYTVALDLPSGTLVYAADVDAHSDEHIVVRAGKRLRFVALDLCESPRGIRRQIDALAQCTERRPTLPRSSSEHPNRERAVAPSALSPPAQPGA